MKKIFILLSISLLVASCQGKEEEELLDLDRIVLLEEEADEGLIANSPPESPNEQVIVEKAQ